MSLRLDAFAILEDVLGFREEPTRGADVEQAVWEQARRRGCSDIASYALLLRDEATRTAEARALADRVTVNETYFFREPQHHAVLKDKLVPEALARKDLPFRVLSVGCSSGEEPYGIALTLMEAGLERESVQILALDASPAVIRRAERARYSEWSLRNVPETTRKRYFKRDGSSYCLSDDVRRWVSFDVRNVVDDSPDFWNAPRFDVVFCRNMLIYLTPAKIQEAIARFASVLVPGGHLFLGHSETSHAGSKFTVAHASDAFFFRRNGGRNTIPNPAPPPSKVDGTSWADAILRSTRRIDALGARGRLRAAEAPARHVLAESEAMDLFRRERFAELLTKLDESASSPESCLLRAAVLTNLGRVAQAEAACKERLAETPSCAEAHYLMGLCREQANDPGAASKCHERAAALSPTFAMPSLRLGMLARRAGDYERARRMLTRALQTFPSQTERQRLLYCGGFSSEALVALCRAELSACEVTP